jgi:hypothetical protein
MSLEALAPDQRAVVQLVLQQERSYDDLAGLLGISTDAVRERARAGLERVGGPGGDLTEEERGEIADYLLGQQSVSRREATRGLLASSADARRWANRVSDAIEDVARSPLPGVPAADDDEPVTAGTAALSTPAGAGSAAAEPFAPVVEDDDEDDDDGRAAATEALGRPAEAPVRARPRPRPDAERKAPAAASGPSTRSPDRRRSSMVGGALLIGGVSLILVVLIVFIFKPGDDDKESGSSTTTAATPTATATPEVRQAGAIPLKDTTGGKAKGTMTIFVSSDNQVAFTIEATGVTQSKEAEAYAVWLTGTAKPKRLGFAPTVGKDGKLGVSGPQEEDAANFPRDLGRAKKVIVSVETTQDATKPGPTVLEGTVPQQSGG